MSQMQVARTAISKLLANIHDIDESVVRGEKRLNGQTYAVAYFDLADKVVMRSQNIREFQEQILGDDFFSSTGDLRWNKYLYIVAGPESSVDAEALAAAKATIEADKDYARKRVVSEEDLASLIQGVQFLEPAHANQVNVLSDWEARLSSNGLDLLLDCPTPRTEAVERVAQGNAKRENSKAKKTPLNSADIHLAKSKLVELSIERFRQIHNGKSYRFGQVTLLVGPNGSGKTSLLEAIEYFYCGHNRRENSTSSPKIIAKIVTTKTGQEYSLACTSETARIKARCLSWYNRDERNAKAIIDAFTRYNFLDTDAAYRISTDLEPREIATDLSRLLMGPSAAVTWDYLTKIHTEIDRAWEREQVNFSKQSFMLDANKETLKEMQNQPTVAKALVDSYHHALRALGWLSASTSSKLESNEGNLLLGALGHLQALQAAGSGARTIGLLRIRSSELATAISEAKPHAASLAELHTQYQAITDAIRNHEGAIRNIDRWITYFNSGYLRLHDIAKEATLEAQKASVRLGTVAVSQLPDIPLAYQKTSLETAKHAAKEAQLQAEKKVNELQILADRHGKSALARATSATRLKEAVLTSQAHTGTPGICPVCKTRHLPEELSRLIEAITDETLEKPELQHVTEALQSAISQLQTERANLNSIQFFDKVASQLGISENSSTADIVHQLVELRAHWVTQSEIARSTVDELQVLEKSGFSYNEYNQILSQVRSQFADGDATLDAAMTVRHELLLGVEEKRLKVNEIQSQMMDDDAAIRSICQRIASPQWNTSVTSNNSFATLVAIRDEFDLVLSHVTNIQSTIAVKDDQPLSELQSQIANVSVAFKEALSAINQEDANSLELNNMIGIVKREELAINKLSGKVSNLGKAVEVLKSLFSESSLESAAQGSLAAIGEQINEVFSRIHSPNEYKYFGKQDALLKTVETDELRTLEQVSTGQRAAFALSIFLSLNVTAKKAPPILLVDDPIAHIDDLNCLSFLDYLRDLAVDSDRQIFFATADNRIASLFSKKFSFLGNSFKTIELKRANFP